MRAPLVCALLLALSCNGDSQKIDPDRPAGVVLEAQGSPSAARGEAGPRSLGPDSELFVQDRLILQQGDSLRFQLFHNAAIATWSGPREVSLAKSSVWGLSGKPIDRMAAGATARTASAGVHTEREAAETEAVPMAQPGRDLGDKNAAEVPPAEDGEADPGPRGDTRGTGGGKGGETDRRPPDDVAKKKRSGGGTMETMEVDAFASDDDGSAPAGRTVGAWLSDAERCKDEIAAGTTVEVRVEARVDRSGKITSLELSGDGLTKALERCVAARLRAAVAPPGRHARTVTIEN